MKNRKLWIAILVSSVLFLTGLILSLTVKNVGLSLELLFFCMAFPLFAAFTEILVHSVYLVSYFVYEKKSKAKAKITLNILSLLMVAAEYIATSFFQVYPALYFIFSWVILRVVYFVYFLTAKDT